MWAQNCNILCYLTRRLESLSLFNDSISFLTVLSACNSLQQPIHGDKLSERQVIAAES